MRIREGQVLLYCRRHSLLVFVILLFLTALAWARARDRFKRIDFTLRTAGGKSVAGIAVLPVSEAPSGTVVYLHGLSGGLMRNGNQLRQFAEMGLAGVSIEYNQTNRNDFNEEFDALNQFLISQSWSKPVATAWVGYSLGAIRSLSYALLHPESPPRYLVLLSGGLSQEIEEMASSSGQNPAEINRFSISQHSINLRSPVLLLHGESDEVFPRQKAERLANLLQTNGTSVSLMALHGQTHSFGASEAVVFRLVAESCKANLAPGRPLVAVSQNHNKPHFGFFIPILLFAFGLVWLNTATQRKRSKISRIQFTRLEKVLRCVACSLAVLALGAATFRWATPRFAVNNTSINLARKFFVAPQEQEDFIFLSSNPLWRGKTLKELLNHVELANYVRTLVNWQINDEIYKEYVLSPSIDHRRPEDMSWRRPLWESFYPRIRKEVDPESAAKIVVRHLRERVSIVVGSTPISSIGDAWAAGVTDLPGFDRIYVAALRSVGVAARLNVLRQVEIWTGDRWVTAPRPLTI